MRFRFYFVCLCLLSTGVAAQNFSLKWDGFKEIDYGTEKITLPFFTNYHYDASGSNIYVSLDIKTNYQVKVEQLQWEELPMNDRKDLKINSITSSPTSNVGYYFNDTQNAQMAAIRINAVKTENNRIYRLASFNVVSTNKSISSLLNGNSAKYGTPDNPLKTGNFYKIKVDKSGIFKITKQFLQQNGINPANVNPKNFRIYGNGGLMLPENNQDNRYAALQEDAIQVVGEDDGVWDDNDYALFYAQGPNGYNLFGTMNGASNGNGYKRTEYRTDTSANVVNIYEDYSYYFINFDIGPGKRVQNLDNSLPTTLITRYDDYQVLNEEKYNLEHLGRVWVGDVIPGNRTVTFTTKSPIQTADAVKFRTSYIAYNAQGGNIKLNVNSFQDIKTISPNAAEYVPYIISGTLSNQSGNTINFSYTADTSANPNGAFYFDYAEVQYKEDLKFNGSQMNFRQYDITAGSNTLYGFSVTNAAGIEQIWDVSDVTNAARKVNKNTSSSVFNFGYQADSPYFNNEFVAFKASAAYEPSFVGKIDNQDLASLSNIDYLIITQPSMMSQAQRIASYHTNVDGYNVQIVDVNKIYNEYSSGSKDITAIRDFITQLNTPAGSLKYVLLVGNSSYDYKNRISGNTDIIPSYQSEASSDLAASYVTDDYFVMTKPQTTQFLYQILPDLPIGRLIANDANQAKILVDKTLAYYNALSGQSTPFGEWRMKMDYVVDDDTDGGPFQDLINQILVNNFENNTDKPEYNIRKLYLDSFPAVASPGGQRYPQVNQAISNDVGNTLFLFYFGHGGINGWAQERVLTSTEINNFNNFTTVYSRFPFVTTITCEFTWWDYPQANSTGEQMIKLATGGAAAMIVSSRQISVDYGRNFASYLINSMFRLENNGDFLPVGDAHLRARKEYYNNSNSSNDNVFRVNFLGDPAMKISRPKKLLQIDNIQTPVPGKIRALDFVTITGHITKSDGTLDSTFNGRVAINIFDKRINKKTLNNDGNGPPAVPNPILDYTEEPSAIVKASGTVVNGNFTLQFYVPKDINYENGNGRILGYADNKSYDVFTNQTQLIGDINPDGLNDNQPPQANLYMNNTNFANGGITDQNPMLLACVKDDTGINSTGAGIGHDITFILDGDVVNTTSVDDYYSSGDNYGCSSPNLADYQKGTVAYPLKNLAVGEHQLTFKVWDINNNSATSTLNFIVKDEADQRLQINRLLNWPNPFTNKTYVQFEHNCDDILDVNVQIYTITGKLVRTLNTSVTAEPFLQGFRTPRQAIEWDGKDDFGDTVAKGTYIFKVFARSQNQDKCPGSATGVEKMVLLK